MAHFEEVTADRTAASPGEQVTVRAKVCRDFLDSFFLGKKLQALGTASTDSYTWTEPGNSYIIQFYPLQIQNCTDYLEFKFTMPVTGNLRVQLSLFEYDILGNIITVPVDTEYVDIINKSPGVVEDAYDIETGQTGTITVTEDKTILSVYTVDKSGTPVNAKVTISNDVEQTVDSYGKVTFVVPTDKKYYIYGEYGGYTEAREVYATQSPQSVRLQFNIEALPNITEFIIKYWPYIVAGGIALAVLLMPSKSKVERMLEKAMELEVIKKLRD